MPEKDSNKSTCMFSGRRSVLFLRDKQKRLYFLFCKFDQGGKESEERAALNNILKTNKLEKNTHMHMSGKEEDLRKESKMYLSKECKVVLWQKRMQEISSDLRTWFAVATPKGVGQKTKNGNAVEAVVKKLVSSW